MELEWLARHRDGKLLCQFKGTTEHLFKEIDQSNLEFFSLVEDDGYCKARVDLNNGQIRIDNKILDFPEFKNASGFRLVYFRRVRQTLGSPEPVIRHHLGWQVTIQGKSHKRVVAFDGNTISIMCE
jgi:hypothetical protein